jgi:hypothetical protein
VRLERVGSGTPKTDRKAAAGEARAFKLLTQLLRDSADGVDVQQPITVVISDVDSRL